MDLKSLADNIEKCVEVQAKMKIEGVQLDQVDASHLQVTDETLNEHVAIQPTAIAYFGVCVKQASRNLECIKFEYELWRKEKYLSVKSNLTGKATINEIDCILETQHKVELREWMEKIWEAQRLWDNAESFYKAWHQKGFTLREHAKLHGDEMNTSGSIMAPQGSSNLMGSSAMPAPFNMNASVARVRQAIAAKDKEKNG